MKMQSELERRLCNLRTLLSQEMTSMDKSVRYIDDLTISIKRIENDIKATTKPFAIISGAS